MTADTDMVRPVFLLVLLGQLRQATACASWCNPTGPDHAMCTQVWAANCHECEVCFHPPSAPPPSTPPAKPPSLPAPPRQPPVPPSLPPGMPPRGPPTVPPLPPHLPPAPPSAPCLDYCATNANTWQLKCNAFVECSGCSECFVLHRHFQEQKLGSVSTDSLRRLNSKQNLTAHGPGDFQYITWTIWPRRPST